MVFSPQKGETYCNRESSPRTGEHQTDKGMGGGCAHGRASTKPTREEPPDGRAPNRQGKSPRTGEHKGPHPTPHRSRPYYTAVHVMPEYSRGERSADVGWWTLVVARRLCSVCQ